MSDDTPQVVAEVRRLAAELTAANDGADIGAVITLVGALADMRYALLGYADATAGDYATCTRAGYHRVEAWHKPGAGVDLLYSLNACDGHLGAAEDAVRADGHFTCSAFNRQGDGRPCGYKFDYRTLRAVGRR